MNNYIIIFPFVHLDSIYQLHFLSIEKPSGTSIFDAFNSVKHVLITHSII